MSATTPPSGSIRISNTGLSTPTEGPGSEPSSNVTPTTPESALFRRVRLDPNGTAATIHPGIAVLLWAVLAGGFVLIGGGNLDPGPDDVRLGLAAGEGLGPFGQVYGGWDPSLWPVRVLASQVWAWGEGGTPTTASIRWPVAIAGLLMGLALTLRMGRALGRRAGLLTALCLFGSVGLMQRTAGVGLDLVTGLTIVLALDRIINRGSDWLAGFWASLAVLSGGWPAFLMIGLPILILGRPGKSLSHRLLFPPLAAFVAWSVWAITSASVEAWGAALALPLTQPTAWGLVPSVLLLSLPWTPFVVLAAFPSARAGWPGAARPLVLGWLQVAGVALLAGTLIPGLAVVSRTIALPALAVVAAAVIDRVCAGGLDRSARRAFLILALTTVLAWGLLAIGLGGYFVAAVSYYRAVCLVLVISGYVLAVVALTSAWRGNARAVLGAVVAVAVCIKVAHWGVFVPEWNYRVGQGAWGRAIGQWVLPNRPIYIVTTWPHHLMFHTERPVRQLTSEVGLKYKNLRTPQYVLLHEAEFDHWPEHAPEIMKIRSFQDERGGVRVLARTKGSLGIRPHAPRWDETRSEE